MPKTKGCFMSLGVCLLYNIGFNCHEEEVFLNNKILAKRENDGNLLFKKHISFFNTFILSSANDFNPFPLNSKFYLWKRKLLETLWEKEKMLVASIFSFSDKVFYSSQHKFQSLSHDYFVICNYFEFGLF